LARADMLAGGVSAPRTACRCHDTAARLVSWDAGWEMSTPPTPPLPALAASSSRTTPRVVVCAPPAPPSRRRYP
jgi:hypothetical protein